MCKLQAQNLKNKVKQIEMFHFKHCVINFTNDKADHAFKKF